MTAGGWLRRAFRLVVGLLDLSHIWSGWVIMVVRLANPLGSTAWKEAVLGLFVIGSACGAGVSIAAAVGCAIVGQLSCMSILS